jgi:hypothetical protein
MKAATVSVVVTAAPFTKSFEPLVVVLPPILAFVGEDVPVNIAWAIRVSLDEVAASVRCRDNYFHALADRPTPPVPVAALDETSCRTEQQKA